MVYLYIIAGLVSVAIAIAIGGRWWFYRSGKKQERLENAEKIIKEVQKSNVAASDSAYDDQLRDRYGLK